MSYGKKYRRRSGNKLAKNVLTVATVVLCIGLIGTVFAGRPSSGNTSDPSDQDKDYTALGFTGLTSGTGKLSLIGDASGAAAYTTTSEDAYVSVQNDLDDMFPFNKIEEYTDEYGNVFVKFPKLYMKWVLTEDGYIDGVLVADKQVDETYFIPDAYLNPTGGLVGMKLYNDYFAIGKYEMSGDAAQGYSKSGAQVLTNLTRAESREAARSYGTEQNLYNGYQQLDMSQWSVYNILCMLYYQTPDIQSVWSGCTSVGFAASTGTTDGCDGLNGWNTETGAVKLLGVENPYGNLFTYLDGVYVQDGAAYVYAYPQDYADSAENAVKVDADVSVRSCHSYGLKCVSSVNGVSDLNGLVFPSGEASNYASLRDAIKVSASGTVVRVGGGYDTGHSAGLFCVYVNTDADVSGVYTGARLTYRPV